LRMPAANAAPTGVDREWECRVLALASAAGIAPTIERCEPRLGVLVTQWEEGRALSADEARRAGVRVAELMRRVHALPLPVNGRALGPVDWIEHYRDAITRLPMGAKRAPWRQRLEAGADSLQVEAGRRLGALEALPHPARVLCHSDLHPANLVATARGLVLLDWEYAHVSEALWDVAGWACNNDLEPAARVFLLASYLGRAASGDEVQRLEHLAWLYDYICVLWSEVYCGAGGDSDGRILERGRSIAARLSRTAGGDAAELPAK